MSKHFVEIQDGMGVEVDYVEGEQPALAAARLLEDNHVVPVVFFPKKRDELVARLAKLAALTANHYEGAK